MSLSPPGLATPGLETPIVDSTGKLSAPWGARILVLFRRVNALFIGSGVVADLPAPTGVADGTRAVVTDATATTFMATVVGGGANTVPVVKLGTHWKIG